MKLTALALALSAFATTATASQNLVQNGSFEDNVVTSTFLQLTEVSGWTSNGPKFEIQTERLNFIVPRDGTQYIELDSTENYSISQTLATEAGKRYKLSFAYSPRIERNEDTNQAEVRWNGEVVAELNGTTREWQNIELSLIADSNATELTFTGTGTSDRLGAFIDDVSVTRQCVTGLVGINNYGSAEEGLVYHFDIENNTATKVAGVTHTASNIASKDGVLYFMEQENRRTRESNLWSLDLETNVQTKVADANSWPIYRSVVTPDGQTLRATSKTYMYDFDLETGTKTVLGKMRYSGDNFKHGDIAYSADNNTLYVLTGKALYTIDPSTMDLTLVGEHAINWASGLAISEEGTLYVSGRRSGENAKIYSLDPQTAAATYVMDTPARINDLTYVKNYCE